MTYKLTYFNLTALAEPIRFLLSYMNVEFEDIRIDREEWPSIKQIFLYLRWPGIPYYTRMFHTQKVCTVVPTNVLGKCATRGLLGDASASISLLNFKSLRYVDDMPFGKLPVLEVNGNVVGQSIAIARYLANKAGLAGNDEWESLMMDIIIGNIDDLQSAMASYAYDPVEESKSRKFSPLINEMVPYYMTTFENIVIENDGYFVNGKLSWADIYFVALLDYMHFMIKCDFLENCPKLKALTDQVMSLPQIKLWLEKRPASVA